MHEASSRNLRTAERFLLAPAVSARFGTIPVAICDISAKGVRIKHEQPLESGSKSLLRLQLDGQTPAALLEGVIVWTQADASAPARFVSGMRTYGDGAIIESLLARLRTTSRTSRIEELRASDRFLLNPVRSATFAGRRVTIENLSARGARIESVERLAGITGELRVAIAESNVDITVIAQVVWSAVKAIGPSGTTSHRAGLMISEKAEQVRLAIGHLCELGQASIDAQSLGLKLKVLRARARQLAPGIAGSERAGIPSEQYLLVQGVREELQRNPEEAMHWYRKARIGIGDAATRALAPPIADHPDALAVWEYLDRSIDPTIIGRAFELPLF